METIDELFQLRPGKPVFVRVGHTFDEIATMSRLFVARCLKLPLLDHFMLS